MPTTHPNDALVVKVGTTAPELELSNTDGTILSLSQAIAAGPVVLVFYRGDW